MHHIAYRGGYKYQLEADYQIDTGLEPKQGFDNDYLSLGLDGRLLIRKGYAWDGPSGPTVDTANFMRGSLVHDALYQLMREGALDREQHRNAADRLLQKLCIEDGMSRLRAWWVYKAVAWFGDPAADPVNHKPIVWAPTPPPLTALAKAPGGS